MLRASPQSTTPPRASRVAPRSMRRLRRASISRWSSRHRCTCRGTSAGWCCSPTASRRREAPRTRRWRPTSEASASTTCSSRMRRPPRSPSRASTRRVRSGWGSPSPCMSGSSRPFPRGRGCGSTGTSCSSPAWASKSSPWRADPRTWRCARSPMSPGRSATAPRSRCWAKGAIDTRRTTPTARRWWFPVAPASSTSRARRARRATSRGRWRRTSSTWTCAPRAPCPPPPPSSRATRW